MEQYLELLHHVKQHGVHKENRTGVRTLSVFGYQMRFRLDGYFPLLTTKKLHIKSIIYELLWFLRGETNIAYLNEHEVGIWDEWADEQGELGPIYGYQWRSWPDGTGGKIDQIDKLIRDIKENPNSRRLIVSAWNVADLDKMALPPCHAFFQFYVTGNRLSCQLYQRSADIFLGVPFNIASYALLTMMIAHVTDLKAYELIHILGDAHLYENHLPQADEQLSRSLKRLPIMRIKGPVKSIFKFTYDDFELSGYQADPHIKASVVV